MVQVLINFLGFVISFIAFIFLLILVYQSRLLRKGLLLIAAGMFISIVLHSFAELIEILDLLRLDTLILTMPILVSLGSFLILFGGICILFSVTKPLMEVLIMIRSKEQDPAKSKMLADMDNEIGALFSAILESEKRLNEANLSLENKVKERTQDLILKNKELEETLGKLYTMRIGLEKDIMAGQVSKEDKRLKRKLDRMKGK